MSDVEISTAGGRTAAAQLTATRNELVTPRSASTCRLAGADALAASLESAMRVSSGLIGTTVEVATLGAVAITNAVLDAVDADR